MNPRRAALCLAAAGLVSASAGAAQWYRFEQLAKGRRQVARRKILVGTIVLTNVDQGVLEEPVLRGWLDSALTRPDDRALFGLSKP
jgi:hypothetical protein